MSGTGWYDGSMASCYTLAVDGMSPAALRRAVAAAVGGDPSDAQHWQPMDGGIWRVYAPDPEDEGAFDFAPSAEVHFCPRAAEHEVADASVGKAVLAVLRANDVNAWLGWEDTETIRRLHGRTTTASRSLWGDLADTLNEGLATAA